jgi:hypothetical protein
MDSLLLVPAQYTDAQARGWAHKADYCCFKARGKQHTNNRGGYQLVDAFNNVVAGVNFELSAAEVVEFCRQQMDERDPKGSL